MKIGFVGLGKMGAQIVTKLVGDGHELIVSDVDPDAVASMETVGARGASSRQDMIAQLGDNPLIWLMIPDKFVEDEVQSYLGLLPHGSVLIDGGNSNFNDTVRRAKQAKDLGVSYIDIGTSGGILGDAHGFSMMVGGDQDVFDRISPALRALAAPEATFARIGPSGAGHYVKMIHNGIEYSLMQAYAEGYHLLKSGPFDSLNLADISRVWQGRSIIQSTLNELVGEILVEDVELSGVDGFVADSGEGRWTFETAQASGVPMPALQQALKVRTASQRGQTSYATKLLAAMRNKFGGHAINKT